MHNFTKLVTLLFGLLLLVSCGGNSSNVSPDMSVTFHSAKLVTRPIKKDFTYNHCSFDVPTDMTITVGEVLSESFTKELSLQYEAEVSAGLQSAVDARIKLEIVENFKSEKKYVYESEQVANFTIPARSYQIYTATLVETLREGDLSFTYKDETHGVHYSYRINLEGTGAVPITLPCPPEGGALLPVTASPVTVSPGLCGIGFDASVWNSSSTDIYSVPIDDGHCWQLENYGLTMSNGVISILENDGPAKASWYGVTRSVPGDASIRFNVHLERLLGGAEIWIGLTDSPSNLDNGKFLVIKKAAQAKPGYISAFSVEGRSAGMPYQISHNVFVPFDTGSYFVEMHLDANKLSIWLNHSPGRAFLPVEIGATYRYLFIGYLATTQVDIDAQVYNIQILP